MRKYAKRVLQDYAKKLNKLTGLCLAPSCQKRYPAAKPNFLFTIGLLMVILMEKEVPPSNKMYVSLLRIDLAMVPRPANY